MSTKRGGDDGIVNGGQWELLYVKGIRWGFYFFDVVILFIPWHLITTPPPSFHAALGTDEEMMGIAGYHGPGAAAVANPAKR